MAEAANANMGLILHQTKARVHVRIIGPEPVAETRSRKQTRRAWRSPLHHKMPVIEEVARITWIRRMRFESRERSEQVARPLPPVAGHLPGSVDSGIPGINRNGIPSVVIEIVADGVR